MNSEKKGARVRTLDEMAGVEIFEDSTGMKRRIKVFTLGELWRFYDALELVLADGRAETCACFLSKTLMSHRETWKVRVRRLMGLGDFSRREMLRTIPAKDVRGLFYRIVEANLDLSVEELVKRIEENAKKKKEAANTEEAKAGMGTKAGWTGEI